MSVQKVSCRMAHHSAAASSNRQVLCWIPSSTRSSIRGSSSSNSCLVYASHSILNLAERVSVRLANGTVQDNIWNIQQTLRTSVVERAIQSRTNPNEKLPVITALCTVSSSLPGSANAYTALVCGFSNGAISLRIQTNKERKNTVTDVWKEYVVVEPSSPKDCRSITAISGISYLANGKNEPIILILTGSSAGSVLYHFSTSLQTFVAAPQHLLESPVCAVSCQALAAKTSDYDNNAPTILALIGTAAPRHNKIHVYHLQKVTRTTTTNEEQTMKSMYAGGLTGHEDWISCFDWKQIILTGGTSTTSAYMLASGSQDAKIRLWLFRTTRQEGITATPAAAADATKDPGMVEESDDESNNDELDDAHNDQGEEEDQEGESRMEIIIQQPDLRSQYVTSVTLEALLLGHEESVTSVSWHPNPESVYGVSNMLISSSMDRAILLWAPTEGGMWTPITRVGSAGGILGGSIGSSLLGYCRATVDPVSGRYLVGHAYGGSLHMWALENKTNDDPANDDILDTSEMGVEERAALAHWKAGHSLTGHYDGVTDLSWEASSGQYLLTVSHDQTCRLWAPVDLADNESNNKVEPIWIELGRPQVHGYDISAVTSVSTLQHPHLLVTGADEKELRVFDAPKLTLQLLRAVCQAAQAVDPVERVERAFIPSLGLSNKASAANRAEESELIASGDAATGKTSADKISLPLERDLGVVSLWPEVYKLFGHNTELYCLASNAGEVNGDVLVASSCKARDVEAAAIRLWNVEEGKCVQVLSGGHKSTVATLSFSPDGQYLASSGKDRRLCIWMRDCSKPRNYSLAWAKDSAHKRIVWSVDFYPLPHDEEAILASGSRDGCVKIWKVSGTENTLKVSELYSFAPSFVFQNQKPDSVTALAFAPLPLGGPGGEAAILGLGLESGRIEVWAVPLKGMASPKLLAQLEESHCHNATVTKLAWRPKRNASKLQLASCSMDCGCRIHEFQFE